MLSLFCVMNNRPSTINSAPATLASVPRWSRRA